MWFKQGHQTLKLLLTESAQTAGATATGERNREWVGGRREKKNEERMRKKIEKGRVKDRVAGTFCYMCLQSIAPPFTGPALTLQDLHHQPIGEQTPGPSLPLSQSNLRAFSEFPSHYIMLSQRLNNIPSNQCSQTAHFPDADWTFCLHLIKNY